MTRGCLDRGGRHYDPRRLPAAERRDEGGDEVTDETFALHVAINLYWDGFHQGERVKYPMREDAIKEREKSIEKAKQRIVRRLAAVRTMK